MTDSLMRRSLIIAGAVLLPAATATAAVEAVAPANGATVGPFAPVVVQLTGDEYGPYLSLYRSAAALAADDAGGVGPVRARTITTEREQRPDGTLALRPAEPIPPGNWIWRVGASAPRGAADSFRRSAPRTFTVARIVQMTRASIVRRGASVRATYRWRTNAERLVHRTEVFHNGRRVSNSQSRIAHSAGTRMAGRTFTTTAALTNNRPPFGRIHRGVWLVRVSISDGVRTARAQRGYRIT